ncbi:ribose ABC transporter permease [Roseobacter cerasinus]|uniref:Ribose ABC transporter permease n=1 Tax=Roseobacter cerasinus TaxID=2602289 RepID=A0A640VZM9_9RHOB|nr:ABC transporter permease [Roseobacter cerasinus]GFE52375.1 ribose ABC transporter permease [Roseobacter cerasinus]
MNTAVATDERAPLSERLEPYMAIIAPMAMIAAIFLFMAVASPDRFYRISNLELILQDAALYMPMAMAMTFVITQRGIDLSVGSVAVLSAIIMAFLVKQFGFSIYVGIPIALSIGALLGLINGLVITRFNVPDLIGTLAMDLVYKGLALLLAKGLVLARFPDVLTEIGRGQTPFFIPTPAVIGILTMVAGYYILQRTHFGRYTVAIGSSPESAELTGIGVKRHKVYAYVLCGACAALAGLMLTGKQNAIQATMAPFFNLHVIAAVVVGGTSLFGGRASIIGSFSGVLLLAMMLNALVTLRIEFFWQPVASGFVIISSVALYAWIQKKDRDGAGGWFADLKTAEGQKTVRFAALIIGVLIGLLAIGGIFAGDPVPSG